MSKLISECCEAEVNAMESDMPDSGFRMQKYIGFQCSECLESCSIKEVSECCEADIEVSMPAVTGYMESPPDPIEHCSECGGEVE